MTVTKRRLINAKLIIAAVIFILVLHTALAAVRTFRVQETDFLSVMPQGYDADKDTIIYNFSSPLDSLGEWQTDYGDAGEYNVFITASDGTSQTTEEIQIIVQDRNEPPRLKANKIEVKETQDVDLKKIVEDPEQDPLEFSFEKPFNDKGIWNTGYEDEGEYIVVFSASDGEFSREFRVAVIVSGMNQPPEIVTSFSSDSKVQVHEGKTLKYFADAYDSDIGNDRDIGNVSYQWLFDGEEISTENEGQYSFSYESSGEYSLTLIVSDGTATTEQSWDISVENVNRKPELDILPITVFEGDKVTIDVPAVDIDGDSLTYTFDEPLNENGEWQTSFNDSGEYNLEVTAFDGDLKDETTITIMVIHVDRAPSLDLPQEVYFKEGETREFVINTSDPDKDIVELTVDDLPEGAVFNKSRREITWKPSYDFSKRRGGLFSEILNTFRIEQQILKTRSVPITITSCGSTLCSKAVVYFVVENINRAPEFELLQNLSIGETEVLNLKSIVSATDPDGDIVRYRFPAPLGKSDGKWKTSYLDAGVYTFNITATDGILESVLPVQVNVKNANRPLELHVNKNQVVVNEGQEFTLHVDASDPDDDNITISLENLPAGASFDKGLFVWSPGHLEVQNKTDSSWNSFLNEHSFLNRRLSQEKTIYWIKFIASDGEYDVIQPVKIVIKNINQPPEIIDYLPSLGEAALFEPVVFHVAAKDADQDQLTYEWDFGELLGEEITGTNTVERVFTTPGEKEIEVTVSDGRREVEKHFVIDVAEPLNEEVNEEVVEPADTEPLPTLDQQPLQFKVYVIKG